MRGGRNKFGPMYKRDRARKLQMMRQRQLAAQQLVVSRGGGSLSAEALTAYGSPASAHPGTSPFANIHIKQEIQIPQVSSLTSSPDSSPSPIAVALGQVSGALSQAQQQSPQLQVSKISFNTKIKCLLPVTVLGSGSNKMIGSAMPG